MSVDWTRTRKDDYLRALTREIEDPNGASGCLPGALYRRGHSSRTLGGIRGGIARLDGADIPDDTAAGYADPAVAEGYAAFERKRDYPLP